MKPILIIGETEDLQSVQLRQLFARAQLPPSMVGLSNCIPTAQGFEGVKVVVPMCEDALWGLKARRNLNNWRGSIMPFNVDGACIPSLPARVLQKSPNWFPRMIRDFKKISKYAQEPFVPKEYSYITHPNRQDVENYVEAALREPWKMLCIDIETIPKEGIITRVGFSLDGITGITVPWDRVWQVEAIKKLCECALPKVFQNGFYDTYWLAQEGVKIENWIYDTLCMHHVLHPTEPHDLAFLVSMYTEECYHKDQAQEHPEEYNCKDACTQWNIAQVLEGELINNGQWEFYKEHYVELYAPLLQMMLGGIRIDEARRSARFQELSEEILALRTKVNEAAGVELYAKKALSPKKLQEYMYQTLKLPPRLVQKSRDKPASLSTNEVTIRSFVNHYPKQFGEVGNLILEARRSQQLSTFYQPQRVDPDGYLRFSMKLNTEAGRLASSSNPKDGGSNIQNQDRECRDMYVPDPGHIFLEFDLSQAESRVVYCLSGNKQLIEEALLPPWEYDHHTQGAADLFGCSVSEVTKDQRYIGKINSHGAQRDMTGRKLQEVLLKAGYVRTVDECNTYIETYHKKHPGVREYFAWIRKLVMKNRALANSWGRIISWPYEYLDDTLYRKAYSFLPQSEIAALLNRRGLVPLHNYIQHWFHPHHARLVNQVHDSLLVSVHPDYAYAIYEFVMFTLNYALELRGIRLTIPVEAKIGLTWKGNHEFKKPVKSDEFDNAVDNMLAESHHA